MAAGSKLLQFQRAHGVLPHPPRLTSNPQPPFTVEYSTPPSTLRRRLKLIGHALLAAGGLWIAFQLLDLIAASVRP